MADDLVSRLLATVAQWPAVERRRLFGVEGLFVEQRLFGFGDAAGQRVVVKLPAAAREEWLARPDVVHFSPSSGVVWREWLQLPVRGPAEGEGALSALAQAHARALESPAPASRPRRVSRRPRPWRRA